MEGTQHIGTILVVDDSVDIREAVRAVLEADGYEVAEASNGAEALQYLRRADAPRLIVLDLMMPVMNGWEFRAEQQRDSSLASIPVVVLSAQVNGASPPEAAGYLRKPVDVEALLKAVEQHAEEPAPPPR